MVSEGTTNREELYVSPEVILDSSAVKEAIAVHESRTSKWCEVAITLVGERQEPFNEFTKHHLGERLAIIVGSNLVTAPTLRAPITPGYVIISGEFTPKRALDLAHAIKPQNR